MRENTNPKASEYARKYRAKYPERIRASNIVNNEVERGRLPPARKRLCELCGERAGVYHHEDYSKPLEVIPLCHKCHSKTQSGNEKHRAS